MTASVTTRYTDGRTSRCSLTSNILVVERLKTSDAELVPQQPAYDDSCRCVSHPGRSHRACVLDVSIVVGLTSTLLAAFNSSLYYGRGRCSTPFHASSLLTISSTRADEVRLLSVPCRIAHHYITFLLLQDFLSCPDVCVATQCREHLSVHLCA